MKKTQIGAAAMALLLAAGLTACASDPASTPEDTTQEPQSVVDTTPQTEDTNEDPEAADPVITVSDQPDSVTVAEGDTFTYTLAQLGGVSADGQYLIQVLHDFEPGETIDFRSTDVSQWEATGEEYLLQPAENVTVMSHDGTTWTLEKLDDLRADDYVYLTKQDGEVVAITLTEDTSAAEDATSEDAPSDPATEEAADAASNANVADGADETTELTADNSEDTAAEDAATDNTASDTSEEDVTAE